MSMNSHGEVLARPYSVMRADAIKRSVMLAEAVTLERIPEGDTDEARELFRTISRNARANRQTCSWCHAPFTSGFGVFCSRTCADAEVRSS